MTTTDPRKLAQEARTAADEQGSKWNSELPMFCAVPRWVRALADALDAALDDRDGLKDENASLVLQWRDERDLLQAENERLRSALDKIASTRCREPERDEISSEHYDIASAALENHGKQ